MDMLPLRPREPHGAHGNDDPQPVAKRQRLTHVADFDDDDTDQVELSELEQYQSLAVPANTCADILGWWKDHAGTFPELRIQCQQHSSPQ